MTITTTDGARGARAVTWTIDPARSSAEFQVKHLGLFTVHGLVERFAGRLVAAGGQLRSVDVVDAAPAPDVAFASRAIAGDPARPTITGTLTIHGVAREVVFDAQVAGIGREADGRERLALTAAADVRHEDFDVEWEDLIPGGAAVIAGHARLVLTLSAVRDG